MEGFPPARHGTNEPGPAPREIRTGADLVRELEQLRRRAARGTSRARVSLDKIAAATGIPRSTVHSYVRGLRLPPSDGLDRIVVALGASPSEQADWAEALYRVAGSEEPEEPEQPEPAAAPAAPASAPVPRQLPAGPVRLIGRDRETALLGELVAERGGDGPAVIAVCGAGGIGKTALVLQWAHRSAAGFPDGQLWVDLRGYGPADVLPPADALERLVRAVGLGTAELPADLDARAALFRSAVAGKRMLLVLDNARDSAQVRPLLPGTPGLVTVVTSRDALRSLVAGHGATRLNLDPLDTTAAHTLVSAGLPDPVAAAVSDEQLVKHCDGLPLALCIVRERLSTASPAEVQRFAAELGRGHHERLAALDLNDASLDTSVRGALTWSYRTLPAENAHLFRLLPLCLLPTFDVTCVAVVLDERAAVTARLLDQLVAANLLEPAGPENYRVHDLVAAFASERLHAEEPAGSIDAARKRLLHHLTRMTEAAIRRADPLRRLRLSAAGESHDSAPDDGGDLLSWVTSSADILAAAAVDAAANGPEELSWPLLERGWHALFCVADTGRLLPALALAFESAQRCGADEAAVVLTRMVGVSHGQSGEMDLAAQAFARGIEIAGRAGLTTHATLDRANLAWVLMIRGELDQARRIFTGSLTALDDEDRLQTIASLIFLELQHGDVPAAARYLPQLRQIVAGELATSERLDLALAIARLEIARGDRAAAGPRLAQVQRKAVEVDNQIVLCEVLVLLAAVHRDEGRLGDAESAAREALRIARRQGYRRAEAEALEVLGGVLTTSGHAAEGLACLEQGLARSREGSVRYTECATLLQLAMTRHTLGDPADASAAARAAVFLAERHGYLGLARQAAAQLPDVLA